MVSLTICYGDKSTAELEAFLENMEGFLDPKGDARLSPDSDLVDFISRGFTGSYSQPE